MTAKNVFMHPPRPAPRRACPHLTPLATPLNRVCKLLVIVCLFYFFDFCLFQISTFAILFEGQDFKNQCDYFKAIT